MSGLSHTPGKRARGKTLRGFESRLLRQNESPSEFICLGFFTVRLTVRLLPNLQVPLQVQVPKPI